jgi:predicted Zn-dependent protease
MTGARSSNSVPRKPRSAFRAKRANSHIQAGQVAEAVAEIDELTKGGGWNASQWYDFARVYAVASGRIAGKKREYADRAIELLSKAVNAGYKDAAHMVKDTDLDTLRDREDFKMILESLDKPRAPTKPSLLEENLFFSGATA